MRWSRRVATAAVLTVAWASAAVANPWNDKTTLSFEAPVMIPGATLPAGTYVFRLMDSPVNRHLVQIYNEDETQLMATAQAIPTKRMEPKGDVVVKMNPTEQGAPIAIKAWFYPGSLYGHEFIYSDAQARDIARRTKTLVLSTDVEGSDVQKGTLYTYDAEGRRGEWKEDAVTMREWNAWKQSRQATAKVAAPGTADNREATAPIVRSDPAGMKVRVDQLEENPEKYIGQTVSVTAEVEEVFGPRLFKIDEEGWVDLDGEVLVYLPSNLAALVREDDKVTVTGTMKRLQHPEIDAELSWLDADADDASGLIERPVLVASSIVGGNNNVGLAIEVGPAAGGATGRERSAGTAGTAGKAGSTESETAAGTSGIAGRSATGTESRRADAPRRGEGAVSDASTLKNAGSDMVGRQVDVDRVSVVRVDEDHGFWIDAGGHSIFVLPADRGQARATKGQAVSVDGIILEMPRALRDKARSETNANDTIYIYATTVR